MARGRGRPRQRVLVVSLQGSAAEERRFVSWLPERPRARPAPVEVPERRGRRGRGRARPRPGARAGLALGRRAPDRLGDGRDAPAARRSTRRSRCPPRTWELARQRVRPDWDADGRLEALLPSAEGALLHPLVAGDRRTAARAAADRRLRLAFARQLVPPGLPGGLVAWPTLALGDDDGDGRERPATPRTATSCSCSARGDGGLPAEPSARRRFPPFTEEEERRHTASTLIAFARDLDGDGAPTWWCTAWSAT